MRRLRVALFTNNYAPFRSGVGTSVDTLRSGLAMLGHEAWVFAPAAMQPVADPPWVFRYPSIPVPTYPGFALVVPFSRRLYRTACALTPDIVHAQQPFLLGPTARRFARRHGCPLVFTYHTRYEQYAHHVGLPSCLTAGLAVELAYRFAGSAALVVAPSQRVAGMLREARVAAPVAVVPTGVPLDVFAPRDRGAARQQLGWTPNAPRCLYVGRLDREKRVDRVLDAFASISAAVADAQLSLVGDGVHAAALRRHAAASPAADHIHFHGGVSHDELPVYYSAADLFLFASESETQGLVVAEAHACGLPAVAVRASGVDEVVRDGETGVLTGPDPRALAAAAVELLHDRARRQAMAGAARVVAERCFSGVRQVEAMVEHYWRLLDSRA